MASPKIHDVSGVGPPPLTNPMRMVLIRMASTAWAEMLRDQLGGGQWYWYPHGQERMILQALFNRDLIVRTGTGLALTEAGKAAVAAIPGRMKEEQEKSDHG